MVPSYCKFLRLTWLQQHNVNTEEAEFALECVQHTVKLRGSLEQE